MPPPTPVVPARADCPRSTKVVLRACPGFGCAVAGAFSPLRVLPPCCAMACPARPLGGARPPPLRGLDPAHCARCLARAVRLVPRSLARPWCALSRSRGARCVRCACPCPCFARARFACPCGAAGAGFALRVRPRGSRCFPSVGFVPRPALRRPSGFGPGGSLPRPPRRLRRLFPLRGPGLRLRARPAALARRVFGGAVLCRWLLPCAPPPRRPRWGLRGARSPKGLPSRSPVSRQPGAYPRPGGALRRR